MKIKLLIASDDVDYIEHLSKVISNSHGDVVSLSICTTLEKLDDMLREQKYDVALLESVFFDSMETSSILLPMMLWTDGIEADIPHSIVRIPKYQRISNIYAQVLENFAKVSMDTQGIHRKRASITAVWSPSGGVGKTTVALALAALEASGEKQVLYLNLESFSSVHVYFDNSGKSISTIFEMLEAKDGNLDALVQSVLCKDSLSDIAYFCSPDSIDDMNVLSAENVTTLIKACSGLAEELIIDMNCVCDERTKNVFEIADRIFLVSDRSRTAKTKLEQFLNCQSVFSRFKDKIYLVANKGAVVENFSAQGMISIPLVTNVDETKLYKAISPSLEVAT